MTCCHWVIRMKSTSLSLSVLLALMGGPLLLHAPVAQASTASDLRQAFPNPADQPMAQAIARGDVRRIQALASTTNLHASGDEGLTFLEWAIFTRHPEVIAALIAAGADASQPGLDGDTVVHMAAMVNDAKYLQALIRAGASVDALNPRTGSTALDKAVLHYRKPQMEMLIAAGADVHHQDQMGNSLLHTAAKTNNAQAVLRLLQLGVDPTLRNAQNVTFQSYLFMSGYNRLNAQGKHDRTQVAEYLTAHGVAFEVDPYR